MRYKKILFSALFFFGALTCVLAQELSYYLPTGYDYNPAIPKPKDVIFHEVGQWHVTHDRLVTYMKALAVAAPDRIKLETMGYTYEGRPQVLLIITSPENHRNLEKIRLQHLQLSDPVAAANVAIDDMPSVVWIGHSIHGNEPSGSNASLLTAYHLAAARGASIDRLLANTVILFDPSFNPDGLQRFSTWANQHKSKNLVSDPNSREFNEVWPGGRFNHYWFDLNRDWLPAVHVESQNRLRWFQAWKPNLLTDHHEQGTNATFFFQPGVPSRVNPLTPAKNQELTAALAKFHAHVLDSIGTFYLPKRAMMIFITERVLPIPISMELLVFCSNRPHLVVICKRAQMGYSVFLLPSAISSTRHSLPCREHWLLEKTCWGTSAIFISKHRQERPLIL